MKKSYLEKLIQNLQNSCPPGTNLARELSDILCISLESAYRRINGKKSFAIEELFLLRSKYGISIDAIAEGNDAVNIYLKRIFNNANTIHGYITDLSTEFSYLLSQKNPHLTLVSADIPFFRLIAYDALIAFKLFYWQKSIMSLPDFKYQNVDLNGIDDETMHLCRTMAHQYKTCNSVELWSDQTINGTLKQIEYYAECSYFNSSNDLLLLYEDVVSLVQQVAIDAQLGVKQNSLTSEVGSYNLWNCELVIDNNSVLISTETKTLLAIGFNSFNAFRCVNQEMIEEYNYWKDSMFSKSTLLSGQADKHRVKFIQRNMEKIAHSGSAKLPKAQFDKLNERILLAMT